MHRCREKNIKLNRDKVKLRRKEVPFMGHVISEEGLRADPDKIKAVLKMPTPTVASVQRFIGFTNYLSKFLPRLSDALEPHRKLALSDVEWFWSDVHDDAVQQVKLLVSNAPVLKYFDLTESLTLQCDTSDKGVGAVLLQKGQPIAYASRALTDVNRFLMKFPTGHGRKLELTCLLTGVETISFVLIITLCSGKSIPLTTLLQEQ